MNLFLLWDVILKFVFSLAMSWFMSLIYLSSHKMSLGVMSPVNIPTFPLSMHSITVVKLYFKLLAKTVSFSRVSSSKILVIGLMMEPKLSLSVTKMSLISFTMLSLFSYGKKLLMKALITLPRVSLLTEFKIPVDSSTFSNNSKKRVRGCSRGVAYHH